VTEALGVSCVKATLCTAVGTQIAVWDAQSWSVTPPPDAPAQSVLESVSCSGTMCMAIGQSGGKGPLAEYLPSHDQVSIALDRWG
jgi:hypothetical protein